MDEYNRAMDAAVAANRAFNAAQEQTARLSKDGRDALRSLTDAHRQYRATAEDVARAQAVVKDGLIDQVNSVQDATVAMDEHGQAMARMAATYGLAKDLFAKSDLQPPAGVRHR